MTATGGVALTAVEAHIRDNGGEMNGDVDGDGTRPSAASDFGPANRHTLHLPDFDMAYYLHGPSSSPHKILFIMGMLTEGAAYEPQTTYFAAQGYHCVSFDHRGVGHSTTPGFLKLHKYNTREIAEDAAALVRHLGWQRYHVVGVSMGGMVALEYGRRVELHPQIASLSLIVTHAGGWGGLAPLAGVKEMAKSIFTTNDEVRVQTGLRLLYSKETLNNEQLKNRLLNYHIARAKTRIPPKFVAALGHSLAVYRHYVSYPDLLRIRFAPFPSMVMVGSEDALVRLSNSSMLAHALGCRLAKVPNAGHGLLAEHPEACNDILLEHFQQADDPRALKGVLQRQRERSEEEEEEDEATLQNREVGTNEALMESESDAADAPRESPYTLEERAVALCCKHNVHCSFHSISGFITGFLPALLYRYTFFDSIALEDNPAVSRWDQALRFALLIGMARGGWRAIRCIHHAYRARAWVIKHNLREKRNNNPNAPRSGIPKGTLEFPYHSFILLATFIGVIWKRRLLDGIMNQINLQQ